MSAPSCTALPDWPTLEQVQDAGYISDVGLATIITGVLFGVCGFLSFLPQIVAFIQVKTVKGTSGLTIALSMVSTNLQFAVIVAAASPKEAACASLSGFDCFTNTLAAQQIFMQAVGATGVFWAFFYYWRLEMRSPSGGSTCDAGVTGSFVSDAMEAVGETGGSSTRNRMAAVGWISVIVSILGLIGTACIAFTAGPCASTTIQLQNVLGGIATVVQFAVWLPQIVLLYVTKKPGSLSTLMVAIQGLGGLIFVVQLAFEQAQLVSILPFVAVCTECIWILAMIWYYQFKRRRANSDHGSQLMPN